MPLPKGTQYRYRKGTKIRLAYDSTGNVVEAKNMLTGATHGPEEFAADRVKSKGKAQADSLRHGGK